MSETTAQVSKKLQVLSSDLAAQLAQMRTTAKDDIDALDREIGLCEIELQAIRTSICLEDATAKIEENLTISLRDARNKIANTVAAAACLDTHSAIDTFGVNSDGSTHRHGARLDRFAIVDHYTTTVDLMALLLQPTDVKRIAGELAKATGAKPEAKGGLRAAAAALDYAAQLDKIIALYAQRKALKEAIAGLVDVSPTPGWTAPVFEQIMPTPSTLSVKRQGVDGLMHDVKIGGSLSFP